MSDMFNKTSLKFTLGFVGILIIGFMGVYIIDSVYQQSENKPTTSTSPPSPTPIP
ncbi:MAG: hypothetical protein ACYC8S_00805 [Minisyncoccota bacterium]